MADLAVTEDLHARTVVLLEELCAISSPSGDIAGLERMAARLGDELSRFGFTPRLEQRADREGTLQPVLVASRAPAPDDYVLLIGHLDTVLPAATPQRRAHQLHATGALDMKGGFAALVGALELLAARGVEAPADALLVAVPDEEVGGLIAEQSVAEWGSRARAVLVLEPGEQRGTGETLVTGRRGLAGWRLRARGRASHSGLAYWEGRSALAAAAAWCGRVQGLSEPGEGPIVNVGRILGGDAEFVDELAEHHGLVGSNHRLNIVADRCVAEGEVRYLKAPDGRRMLAAMEKLALAIGSDHGVEMELTVFETITPVDPHGPGRVLADGLVEDARRAGWQLELESDRGGVSFPNFLTAPGEIAVIDGLGPVGGGMHTREEFVDLVSLERRIGLLAGLLERLGDDA